MRNSQLDCALELPGASVACHQATVSTFNYRLIIVLTSPLGNALAAAVPIGLHLQVTGDRYKNSNRSRFSSYRSCRSFVG
jgi:hypothetical protein